VEKLGAKPRRIASLYLGRWEGDRLLYAGKARSGYTEKVAREVREALDPLITGKSPLAMPVKKPKATWLEPIMPAEIAYGGVTDDGLLREAVFKGLRQDLMTPEVKAPPSAPRQAAPAHKQKADEPRIGVSRANILQLLPDALVPSKDALAAYWRNVAKRALPHLGRRPLKLVRHTHDTTFYHKGPLPCPSRCISSRSRSAKGAKEPGCLRNGRGTTAIGAYAPRARSGFPIAAPVTWKDIENGIGPDAFTIQSPFRKRSGA
jgi:bifunctional non-homologous end joining protein LigD